MTDSLKMARRWVTPTLERFFEAEIANERDGGVSPGTLSSAIDSLNQGGAEVWNYLTSTDLITVALIRDHVPGDTLLVDLFPEDGQYQAGYNDGTEATMGAILNPIKHSDEYRRGWDDAQADLRENFGPNDGT